MTDMQMRFPWDDPEWLQRILDDWKRELLDDEPIPVEAAEEEGDG